MARLKRHVVSLFFGGLCLLILFGWWRSSRFSERHLYYFDRWTVEVFSASSLIRLSFVNGEVGHFGSRTFYKHPNARGSFTVRPLIPSVKRRPDMVDFTFGYWHLFLIALLACGLAIVVERARIRACSPVGDS